MHNHSLNTLAGYAVRVTIEDGEVLQPAREVARWEHKGEYLNALEYARSLREASRNGIVWPWTWAVVCPIYTDGCTGGPF